MPINLNNDQAQLIVDLDTSLDQAFQDGVSLPAQNPSSIAGLPQYGRIEPQSKAITRSTFRLVLSAFVSLLTSRPPYTDVATFGGGWSVWGDSNYNNGQVHYSKDLFGYVTVQGLVRTPPGAGYGTVIFTLPPEYRPASGDGHIFPAVMDDTFASVQVLSDGTVGFRGTLSYGVWLSLNFRFRAG